MFLGEEGKGVVKLFKCSLFRFCKMDLSVFFSRFQPGTGDATQEEGEDHDERKGILAHVVYKGFFLCYDYMPQRRYLCRA